MTLEIPKTAYSGKIKKIVLIILILVILLQELLNQVKWMQDFLFVAAVME